jgi:hypothetical protein
MKIVTTKQHRRNQIVTINGVTIKFDGDLKSEVTEKEFETITLKDDSISKIVELPLKPVDDKSKGKAVFNTENMTTEEVSELSKVLNDNSAETTNETDTNPGDATKDPNAETGTGKDKTFAEELAEMKMGELKDLAKESVLPESEWKGIKKKDDLITYLLSKIKE